MAQSKTAKHFETTIIRAGKTATGIQVPDEIIEQLGAGKKPPVRITVNGYTYRSTIAVMGGVYMIGLSAEHRKASGIEGGDRVSVTLELDTEVREVAIPAELQTALNKNAAAKQSFEALSFSKKQGIVLPVKDAKTDETRQKRIEKAISQLTEGK
jgi:hypothetical protein